PCGSGQAREHRQRRCHPLRRLFRGRARSHRDCASLQILNKTVAPAGAAMQLTETGGKRKARGKDAAGCKNVRSRVSVPMRMSAFREAEVTRLSWVVLDLTGDKNVATSARHIKSRQKKPARKAGKQRLKGEPADCTRSINPGLSNNALTRHPDQPIQACHHPRSQHARRRRPARTRARSPA
ncbi:hypothetical protein IAE39_005165, partial [Pseudomonas sp. S37]|nr:hypothetical protein [Pseudomonas sp. S37]